MRKFLFAVLTAVVSLSNLGFAAAQTGPTGPQAPTVPSTPAAPAVNGISETEMLNYLRTLDPNVQMQKFSDGKATQFKVKLIRDGWRYDLVLHLTERGLEIRSELATIANIQSVPSPALAQLLKENWKMIPAFYLFQHNDGRLVLILHHGVARTGVTTASVNNMIVQFCNTVRQTYPAWSAIANASK